MKSTGSTSCLRRVLARVPVRLNVLVRLAGAAVAAADGIPFHSGSRLRVGGTMGRHLLMRVAVALTGVVVLASSPAEAASLRVPPGRAAGGEGGGSPRPCRAQYRRRCRVQFSVVRLGGQLQRGGSYLDSSVFTQAWAVSQVHGVWGKAEEVPGTAALNKGGGAEVNSVSCAAAGSCSAGGQYTDSGDNQQAFVVSQVHGVWGKAEEVPGTAALNKGGQANVLSVSCASAGNCSAAGLFAYFYDGMGDWYTQAFVDSQVNGRWGKAKTVPNAGIFSLSCASASNCSAGGGNTDRSGKAQAFVDSQVNGRWGTGEEVPGIAVLNKGGDATIWSVSCASAGHCSAVGTYSPTSRSQQAFVVSQT